MSEDKGFEAPERPWFRIGEATKAIEEEIREFALVQGFENLRGFWKWMDSVGWDYYDVINVQYKE